MITSALEIERKYDVPADAATPDLADVIPGATSGPPRENTLVATYLDTDDLRLRRARVTLRHRTGGADEGWHLKLPRSRGRLELASTADGPPAAVPEELAALVRAVTRDRVLTPVAELRTRRTTYLLHDAAGRLLLELADDTVEARGPGGDLVCWREWEVELLGGEEALLDAVEGRLHGAGATRSLASSKVGRVLDAAGAVGPTPPAQLGRHPSAGEVVRLHLAEQVAELLARDPDVRCDVEDSVHKMRVATRRLRSALRTFRPLLADGSTDVLREELRWLAGVLGTARDAEVLHERLRLLLAEQPVELVLGPVLQRVDDVFGERYRTAHGHVLSDLDSGRCLALYDALEQLVAAPPWRKDAARPAKDVLPGLVARVDERLARALHRAELLPVGEVQDEALHEARKLAKRLRYACEAVQPVFGARAGRMAAAVTTLQELLGEHQDSVGTREVLRELGAGCSRAGQNGFTFGRLHGLEEARAGQRSEHWRDAAERAARRKLRKWLHG